MLEKKKDMGIEFELAGCIMWSFQWQRMMNINTQIAV